MPRVTLVNRFAYPDDSPTSRLMTDLATMLATARPDIEIDILACNRHYNGAADALPAREQVGRLRITRLWVPSASRAGLLVRALAYYLFYLQGLFTLLFRLRRNDLVICMTDPPMFNVLASLAAQIRGAQVIQWIQDLYPDVVQSAGLMQRAAPLLRFLGALRRTAFRASSRLVVIGEGMRDRLERDGSGCPIEVIPNWANGDHLRPVPREQLPLSKEWLPPCRFVVGYFGNLGFAHNFHSSLQAALRLRDRIEVQFVWVGDGSRRPAFLEALQALQLSNVHWQGQQPFERMPEILGIADIHLVMLDPQFDEVLVPSKTYSALAAGRGLLFLGNPSSELARLIHKHQVGVVVAMDDVDGIVAAIHQLADDPEECVRMGQRARQLFDDQFEHRRVMDRWQQLIDQLLPPTVDIKKR